MAYYIVEFVRALAWPIAAIAIAVLVRPALLMLLPWVDEVSVGPFRAKFNRGLQEAYKKASGLGKTPAALEPSGPSKTSLEAVEATLASLAASQPAAAILAQWEALELLLDRLIQRRNVQPHRDPLVALQSADVIDSQAKEVLQALRKLRNEVAHRTSGRPAPTAVQAGGYVKLGDLLSGYLTNQMLPPAKLTPTGSGTTLNGRGALARAGDRTAGRFEVSYDELDAITESQAQAALPGGSQAVFEGELDGDRVTANVHVDKTETDARDRKHVAVITVTGPINPEP